MVISDWGGVHDTREAIFKGLDMEFGTWTDGLNWGATNAYGNYYLANPYLECSAGARWVPGSSTTRPAACYA